MEDNVKRLLIEWAETYNDPKYFQEDPIAFPRQFAELAKRGERSVRDVEVAAVFAAHFAWGRRAMCFSTSACREVLVLLVSRLTWAR